MIILLAFLFMILIAFISYGGILLITAGDVIIAIVIIAALAKWIYKKIKERKGP